METIGIRELKSRLSEIVRAVRRAPMSWSPIAGPWWPSSSPPGARRNDPAMPPSLARLVERGAARIGAPNDPALYASLPPLSNRLASVGRLLDEERDTR